MNKQQGSLTKIIDDINIIWPFKEQVILIKDNFEGYQISVVGNPDFTFEVKVRDKIFVSQPVIISAVRYVIMTITWELGKDNPVSFYLDGIPIDSVKKNKKRIVIATPPSSGVLNSGNDLSEYNDKWERWRSKHYENPVKRRGERKKKSMSEQFNELSLAIETLKSELVESQNNADLFLYKVLPVLRALVFWKDNSLYSPLLFRLAGYLNHKLVIYAMPKAVRNNTDLPSKESIVFSYQDNASMEKLFPNQVLTDFQEWLCTNVITGDSIMTYRDIIEKAANTMSFAHFDPDNHIIIEELKGRLFLASSMLFDIIQLISKITCELGSQLIWEYKNRSPL